MPFFCKAKNRLLEDQSYLYDKSHINWKLGHVFIQWIEKAAAEFDRQSTPWDPHCDKRGPVTESCNILNLR